MKFASVGISLRSIKILTKPVRSLLSGKLSNRGARIGFWLAKVRTI